MATANPLTPVMQQAMRASQMSPRASYADVQAEAQRLTTAMPTNGGEYTPEQIRQAATRQGYYRDGKITNPQAMYDAAQKYGISSDQIDNVFGMTSGTTNSWIQQQGYNPLATNANGYRADTWNAPAGSAAQASPNTTNGMDVVNSYQARNPVVTGGPAIPARMAAAAAAPVGGVQGSQYIPNVASDTSMPQAGVVAQGMPQTAWDVTQAAAGQGVVQPVDPWQASAAGVQGPAPMPNPNYGWNGMQAAQAANTIQPVSNTYPSGTTSGQLVNTGSGVSNMLGDALKNMWIGSAAGYAR